MVAQGGIDGARELAVWDARAEMSQRDQADGSRNAASIDLAHNHLLRHN